MTDDASAGYFYSRADYLLFRKRLEEIEAEKMKTQAGVAQPMFLKDIREAAPSFWHDRDDLAQLDWFGLVNDDIRLADWVNRFGKNIDHFVSSLGIALERFRHNEFRDPQTNKTVKVLIAPMLCRDLNSVIAYSRYKYPQ
jgi:hypothetical protein